MSKVKFFMLVGLPGSGKSTWAQQNKGHYQMFDEIYSSDEYRKKLLGDINDQSQNAFVFKTLHTDIITALKEGKSVCYDATNITRKSRRGILTLIEMNHIECDKVAVLFAIEPSIVYKQNDKRERKVPEEVIHKMLCRFEMPFRGEGFDAIDVVFRRESELTPFTAIFNSMYGIDQNNPHHTLSLYDHCHMCFEHIKDKALSSELAVAALLHDVGKLYTATYDEEKQLTHYIGHESYGAYKALFFDYSPFVLDRFLVAFYINYHMEPYRLKDAKSATLDRYKTMFGDEWDNIQLIHEADVAAH